MSLLLEFCRTILLLIPEYVANGSPPVISKILEGECTPIDGGRMFIDGKRILGDGKTIEGFIGGVLAGYSISLFIYSLLILLLPPHILSLLYIPQPPHVLALSVLALSGDLLGAFIKRRLGLARGAPAPVLDQLDFLMFPLVYMYAVLGIHDYYIYIIAILFTLFMHLFTNYVAYKLGIKSVPW
ncbi:MAG: CDP-2,3-bis-(O-geranylgeranyl)-sn-glycerol synthase [Crenarchaeota archaeon]|nr:CDP-2,3-bis-(O-geranylgeranyl)-sn-glycerol synthase [Thermoproteota archaeon]